ncbi:major tail protein [Streptococcus phage CHPC1198]|uniref:Major tail protein n=1 Tax=Streptococcus phage CHPC1198 TaxID=2492466 RepID=A0A7R6NGR1_9CAUD|nr:major tail protein [Streptococcus phage CHPC1198]AZS06115.1 major tail protein [Streptococcus phage CHPC1198]
MAKFKNAIRKHYIAPYDPKNPDKVPTDDKYMWIAKGIKESAPENDIEDDDVAYFDGDGTKETVITSKSRGRSFEGHRDYDDKAQNFVVDKEDALGDDLIVWYKEVAADGKTYKEGLARLSEIEVGDGEASELETIKFQVNWSRTPEKHEVAPSTTVRTVASSPGIGG